MYVCMYVEIFNCNFDSVDSKFIVITFKDLCCIIFSSYFSLLKKFSLGGFSSNKFFDQKINMFGQNKACFAL